MRQPAGLLKSAPLTRSSLPRGEAGKSISPTAPAWAIKIAPDPAHDGKFSWSEAGSHFIKGFISPITGMLESPKHFLLGMGILLGGAGLVIATGGIAAPILVAAGIGMGGIQLVKAIDEISHAKSGDEIEKAFFEIGAAAVAVTVAAVGAKSSLKSAGELARLNPAQICRMSLYRAVVENLKALPQVVHQSLKMFKSGEVLHHLSKFASHLIKEPIHVIDPQIELVAGKPARPFSLKPRIEIALAESPRSIGLKSPKELFPAELFRAPLLEEALPLRTLSMPVAEEIAVAGRIPRIPWMEEGLAPRALKSSAAREALSGIPLRPIR